MRRPVKSHTIIVCSITIANVATCAVVAREQQIEWGCFRFFAGRRGVWCG